MRIIIRNSASFRAMRIIKRNSASSRDNAHHYTIISASSRDNAHHYTKLCIIPWQCASLYDTLHHPLTMRIIIRNSASSRDNAHHYTILDNIPWGDTSHHLATLRVTLHCSKTHCVSVFTLIIIHIIFWRKWCANRIPKTKCALKNANNLLVITTAPP